MHCVWSFVRLHCIGRMCVLVYSDLVCTYSWVLLLPIKSRELASCLLDARSRTDAYIQHARPGAVCIARTCVTFSVLAYWTAGRCNYRANALSLCSATLVLWTNASSAGARCAAISPSCTNSLHRRSCCEPTTHCNRSRNSVDVEYSLVVKKQELQKLERQSVEPRILYFRHFPPLSIDGFRNHISTSSRLLRLNI